MKSLEEIKNEVAVECGYPDWSWTPSDIKAMLTDRIATDYAKQRCDEQIKACAYEVENNRDFPNYACLNTPNVVTTK